MCDFYRDFWNWFDFILIKKSIYIIWLLLNLLRLVLWPNIFHQGKQILESHALVRDITYISILNLCVMFFCCFSVTQLCLTLWLLGLQHAMLSYPSPSPGDGSNSCPLSWWCHPTISFFMSLSPPAFNLFQHQGLF